jgi:hypothetical protein
LLLARIEGLIYLRLEAYYVSWRPVELTLIRLDYVYSNLLLTRQNKRSWEFLASVAASILPGINPVDIWIECPGISQAISG